MTTLTGKQIANTYKQLLQVGSGNIGLTTTLQDVQDGDSNNSALQLSNSTVNINGLFGLNGVILTVGASTLNALTSSVVNITTGNDTVLFTQAGVSVSTASTSLTAVVNPTLSITNLYASTGIFLAGSAIPSTGDVAAVSALTSVNKAAITSINTVVAAVSALTSVNKAAITSINAGPASTFDALTVKTTITVGPDTGGNKGINILSSDGLAVLEMGGATGAFIDLKAPSSDDFDLRLGSSGTGGYIRPSEGASLSILGSSETLATFTDDGSVALYHNNVKKLETAADGVDVDDINLNGKVLTITGDTGDTFKITAGTHGATTLATVDTAGTNGLLTLDADGRIHLDAADAGVVILYNNGTRYSSFDNSGSDFNINNLISDGDILFKGKDGGSGVTALTLDMSEAGKATFNDGATLNGDVTLTGAAYNVVWDKSDNALEFADNAKAKFGNSDDLEIWHDGLNSNIKSGGAGSLIISSNFSQTGIVVVPSGKVSLYHNNAEKLQTTATGATVTGGIVADSATIDDISLDGKVLTITGDTDDTFTITAGAAGATTLATTDAAGAVAHLTLDADGDIRLDAGGTYGQTHFKNNGTHYGTILNVGNDLHLRSIVSDGNLLIQGNDGGVTVTPLYFNMSAGGTAVFNAGVTFTGASYNGGWSKANNSLKFDDNANVAFGTSSDLKIYHDGSDSYISEEGTGNLNIQTTNGGGVFLKSAGESLADFYSNGAVNLYHDNSAKLATTATGATVTGAIVADSATVDDISLDGKVLTITGDTGDTFTITAGTNGATTLATTDTAGADAFLRLDADGYTWVDSGNVIILDAGDTYGTVRFDSSGSAYGTIYENSDSLHLKSNISDANIFFQGNDGGSTITALTLDMSEAGKAIFNAGATFADDVTVEDINLSGKVLTITGDTGDTFTITSGANGATTLATVDTAGDDGHLTLNPDGHIILDSGDEYGAIDIKRQGGNTYASLFSDNNTSGNLYIRNNISNADIKIVGNDGGVFFNALHFDMSEAGAATFNDNVTVNGNTLKITGAGNKGFQVESTDAIASMELGGTTGAFIDLKRPFSDDYDIRFGSGGAGGFLQVASGQALTIMDNVGSTIATFADGDSVDLYHNHSKKFETTAAGATVTGGLTADSATIDDISLDGKVLTITGDTGDTFTITTGAAGATTLATTDAAGSDGRLIFSADGMIDYSAGDTYGQHRFFGGSMGLAIMPDSGNSGTNAAIRNNVADGDILLRGNDGGSYITALRLDMSDAGAAYFNNDVNTSWLNDNYFRMYYDDNYHMGMHMEGDTRDLILYTKSADNAGDIRFQTGSTPTERMTILADGKVGIGTSAPTELLHVKSTGDAVLLLEADSDNSGEDDNASIILKQDGGLSKARVGFADNTNTLEFYNELTPSTDSHIRFGTANTERMTILQTGNIGIGTTTPLKKLHVDGPALSTVKTLTDASTVTSDFDVGQNFTLTLAGNRTLGAPSNVDAGQVGSIFIIQDGTGSRTLAYNSIWKFAGGTAPTLSTAAGAIDRLDYIVQSGTAIQAVLTKAYA